MLGYVDSIVMSDAANTQTLSETQTVPESAAPITTETTAPITPEMNQSTSELFIIALDQQQKNALDQALNAYLQILASPDLTKDQASVAHHNLSIIYLHKNEFSKAQIENYLALAFNPGNSAARSLNKSNENFKNSVVQADRSWTSSFSLKFIPVEIFFVLLLGCLFFIAKILLDYLKSRALAAQDNLEIPKYPLSLKLLTLPLLALSIFLGIRFYDENIVKAIVVKENTEVAASAGANQAVITTVNPGLEVIVLRQQTTDNVQYAQIRSTGQFSGWVKTENLTVINR